jgi:hypothetical protein
MIPYWALFCYALLGVLAPYRLKPAQSRIMWMVAGLGIAILLGFRDQVGGDWNNYARQFEWVSKMSFWEAVRITKDPGYYPLGWAIARLGGNIYLLNFFCAVLLTIGTVMFSRRQTLPWLTLLAAIPYLLIVVGMGYTRQSAAIGCVLIGLSTLGRGKRWPFVFWALVGAAFHKSATLLIPIAAVSATKNRAWTYFWVGIMAVVGYWVFVRDSTDLLWQNYVESDYADASQGAMIRTFMNMIPAVVFLLNRRKLSDTEEELRLWTWLAVLAIACLPMLALSATAVDRLALYLIPLQLFVFGRITRLGRAVNVRTSLVLASVVYYAAVEFVWLNYAGHAKSWIPYSFMPLS